MQLPRLALSLSLVSLLALSTTAGCGGSDPVSVGAGTTPEYSWELEDVTGLTVIRGTLESGDVIWAIQATGTSLASPVTHGTVPSDATELVQAYTVTPEPTLSAGVDYQVWLERAGGTREFTAFTP